MDHIETATAALDAAARADNVEERLADLARARREAEAAIRATVAEARAAGRSWARIGSSLGVTRQAAQTRYAALVKATATPSGPAQVSPSRAPRRRTELVALATAGGWPLLRVRVERLPIPAVQRSTAR